MIESDEEAFMFEFENLNSDSDSCTIFSPSKRAKLLGEPSAALKNCPSCGQSPQEWTLKSFEEYEPVIPEEIALTDNRLQLFDEGESLPDEDRMPLNKVTRFSVFDTEGHLCPFDDGLIESGKKLYFCGYIKPIYEEDPRSANGIPVQEMGPIEEWWIGGFDGGDSIMIGFKTPYADYILMEPSPDYVCFMRSPKQKALLTKIVIEFLGTSKNPSYENLLSRLKEVTVPDDFEPLGEDCIEKHAQFLMNQIQDIDERKEMLSTPAAQEIIQMFNVKMRFRGRRKKTRFASAYRPTTTPLVRNQFDFFFGSEVSGGVTVPAKRPKRSTRATELSEVVWKDGWDFALVNRELVCVQSFVILDLEPEETRRIFRVEYFFLSNFTRKVHCTELIKGTDTILKDASHPREYFLVEKCTEWPICKIVSTVDVKELIAPTDWKSFLEYNAEVPKEGFFVQKIYNEKFGTFEDYVKGKYGNCRVCLKREETRMKNTPVTVEGKPNGSDVVIYEKITWKGEEYAPGTCVYVEPFAVLFDTQKSARNIEQTVVTIERDEVVYPEFYRKGREVTTTEECPHPYAIGRIKNIFYRNDGSQNRLFITINKFYRPENTRVAQAFENRDFQLLFWSNEEAEVPFVHVRGRCDVFRSKTPPPAGPHPQFYFNEEFHAETATFSKAKAPRVTRLKQPPVPVTKLKTLNAFSGCGGLAEGLRQSGIVDIRWAVEEDQTACATFKANFPATTVFEMDCNQFLKDVLSGKSEDENKVKYPVKGDVDFIVGGPPCQGFSLMNRFSVKDDLQYNNSLILTFLSFCDHYRPKYVLLENVRNFVSFKRSMYFRHTLGCLVAMGYQCAFGVVQSGNYGVAQHRSRIFVVASAPGFSLPNFPQPTHVFSDSQKNFEYELNGSTFCCRIENDFSGSAPYRQLTVWDAISDLPQIAETSRSSLDREDGRQTRRSLGGPPREVLDHVSKKMSILNEARIKNIPAGKSCDWRDLPNIQVRLRDETTTDLLRYHHHDVKNGRSRSGRLRGVCPCASGLGCDPGARQNNTLIPWFLVHTANRNGNWQGLFGRLEWSKAFGTITTNPEPSSQQGRVLHPTEDRVISVRECARAQGLPDTYTLHGSVPEKYKQVGNAVPSPVARAFGVEVGRSMFRDKDLDEHHYDFIVSEEP